MSLQSFGEERSQRYNIALKHSPYARINELIPLLLFLQRKDLYHSTLVDMASGTGYVTDLLKPLVKRVVRIDKSPEMMALAQEDANVIYADLREVYSIVGDRLQADMITCLAALHHICEIENEQANSLLSERNQSQVIEECAKMLAPGGRLLFVDVGIPDLYPSERHETFIQRMERYYQSRRDEFQRYVFSVNQANWSALVEHHPDYFIDDYSLGWLPSDVSTVSLARVIDHQHLCYRVEHDKTLVVDFFDEVVAHHSIDGHIAYFPREQRLRAMLEQSNLRNTFVACLPTPWTFHTEAEAVWFVRELFALGKQAFAKPDELVRQPEEYQRIKGYIQQYLGMSTEGNITSINWQLMFAYGERPFL